MEVGGWRGWRGCQLAGAEAGVQDQGKLGIGVPFNSCYHQLLIPHLSQADILQHPAQVIGICFA